MHAFIWLFTHLLCSFLLYVCLSFLLSLFYLCLCSLLRSSFLYVITSFFHYFFVSFLHSVLPFVFLSVLLSACLSFFSFCLRFLLSVSLLQFPLSFFISLFLLYFPSLSLSYTCAHCIACAAKKPGVHFAARTGSGRQTAVYQDFWLLSAMQRFNHPGVSCKPKELSLTQQSFPSGAVNSVDKVGKTPLVSRP